jgi:hypothetical protein
LKENSDAPVVEPSYAKIADAKAQIFAAEVAHNTKTQRLQAFEEIEAQVAVIRGNIEEARARSAGLEQQLAAREANGPDYSPLTDRLQQLKIDPGQAEMERLIAERKELKQGIKVAEADQRKLRARLDGQQGMAILSERKAFLEQLQEANVRRKQRMELHLSMLQKKMRQEAFQLEMRSFV